MPQHPAPQPVALRRVNRAVRTKYRSGEQEEKKAAASPRHHPPAHHTTKTTTKILEPLLIEARQSRQPGGDLIRRHAEGLAYEIHNDVMAGESEVADAIEHAIRRFAGNWREAR